MPENKVSIFLVPYSRINNSTFMLKKESNTKFTQYLKNFHCNDSSSKKCMCDILEFIYILYIIYNHN